MSQPELESQLREIIRNQPNVLAALEAVRSLNLPDWAIGAGFIRSAMWDHICGMAVPTPVDDVDVLYHDPEDLSWTPEERAEMQLRAMLPAVPWSVRNQARMHLRKGHEPFTSTFDAMRYWLETPTCVALRLETSGTLTVLAPYGLEDLFARRIRPTAAGHQHPDDYMARVMAKRWHERWPGVVIERL